MAFVVKVFGLSAAIALAIRWLGTRVEVVEPSGAAAVAIVLGVPLVLAVALLVRGTMAR